MTVATVTCWCERGYVHVPVAWIVAGRTAECGRPDCWPMYAARVVQRGRTPEPREG